MRLNHIFLKFTGLLVLILILSGYSYGQSYGLGFYSHEVVQDKRTALDLSPEKSLVFNQNFDLSFDLSFYSGREIYFGYIFRLIEDDRQSIDLVYNAAALKNHFNLIIGGRLTPVIFDINANDLFNHWNKIQLKIDYDHDRLILIAGNKEFIEKNLKLKRGAGYKMLFGINNYKQFETTDVPPMKLQNIRITQNDLLKYNWPLTEENGTVAHEVLLQNDASVLNPLWVTALHHDWQLEQSVLVDGAASVSFDPGKEAVLITGSDSVYRYTVSNSLWTNKASLPGKYVLNQGNQSVYNPLDSLLYNFYFFLNKKYLAAWSTRTCAWNKTIPVGPVTDFWHVNKSVSAVDTALYVFGGYGHLVYKNTIQRYRFNSHIWDTINPRGDFFMPRYLAALGATSKGDTVYLLGGYGNASGQQILSPGNMYDMMRFTVKDQTFKKLFTLKNTAEDFVLANSLVIDSASKSWYGLIFPRHKYNSSLQLIHGSLTGNTYSLAGNAIPFNFHDTHSYADLYYCRSGKKFIAVTLLRLENNQTRVSIYSLLSPPYRFVSQAQGKHNFVYLVAAACLLIILLIANLAYRRGRKAASARLNFDAIIPEGLVAGSGTSVAILPVSKPDAVAMAYSAGKNSVFLFGELQLFDAAGVDLTRYFTPLIRELFLVILVYSIKKGRGLSSEKLNEILWFDKDAKSARNNRSVNIAKLKSLLEKLGYCHLSKESGYWKINIDYSQIHVDYYVYLSLVRGKALLTATEIRQLSSITSRGNFLLNNEYAWLDSFKSEISNEAIEAYLLYAHSLDVIHDAEMLIEMADNVFNFDPVNEEATILKCQALHSLGRHTLAKHTFENFAREYKIIYGEAFSHDFTAILENRAHTGK